VRKSSGTTELLISCDKDRLHDARSIPDFMACAEYHSIFMIQGWHVFFPDKSGQHNINKIVMELIEE